MNHRVNVLFGRQFQRIGNLRAKRYPSVERPFFTFRNSLPSTGRDFSVPKSEKAGQPAAVCGYLQLLKTSSFAVRYLTPLISNSIG
jgi:hypothetical protein